LLGENGRRAWQWVSDPANSGFAKTAGDAVPL